MKRFLLFLSVVLLSFPTGAHDFTLNQGYVGNRGFFEVLAYESCRDLVIIRVDIAGKTRRFLLDTGAPTVITRSIQKKAKFERIGTVPASDFNGQQRNAAAVRISTLSLGGLSLYDIPALVAEDDNPVFAYLDVEGIIGSNLLRQMIVQISSRTRTVIFTDDKEKLELATSFGGIMQTDKDIQSSPVITVRIGNGVTEELLLDTGFDGFYDIAEAKLHIFRQHNVISVLGNEYRTGTYGIYGHPGSGMKTRVLVPEYQVGGLVFKDVTAFSSNTGNSRLGAKLLHHSRLTLDYIHNRFYLEPYSSGNYIPMQASTEAYYCAGK